MGEHPSPRADRPGRFEDLPWRVKHRIRTILYTVFGPAELSTASDPLERLKRERQQRWADRAGRRADQTSGDQ